MSRPSRPLSRDSLQRAALRLLERRGASRKELERALERRVARAEEEIDPQEASEWIASALAFCEEHGYLNDQRVAEDKASAMRRRGSSARKIRAKLAEKGIGAEVLAETFDAEDDSAELDAARKYAQRRRFDGDAEKFDKQLASMARAGFGYAIAKRVLIEARGEDES